MLIVTIDGEMAAKCILISGTPGIGKTTLMIRVLENLRISHPNLKIQGFYTREIRQGNQRVGFEVVTMAGLRAPLASINNPNLQAARWPTVGRYHVDVASFERVVLPELQIHEDTDLFVIDEVGKMELYSSSFLPAVLRVLNSNIPLLASIPVVKHGRDIPGGCYFNSEFLYGVDKLSTDKEIKKGVKNVIEKLASDMDTQIKASTELFMYEQKMDSFGSVVAQRAIKLMDPFDRIRNHPGATLYMLNPGNRDEYRERVYSQVVDLLRKH